MLSFSTDATALPNQSLSLIIAGKNEAAKLPALLQALQAQTYPNFEVIYANDHSTDSSLAIFTALTLNDKRFHIFQVETGNPSKKTALNQAIQKAQYERLVFTDADCLPPSNWLFHIAKQHALAPKAVFVGFSPMVAPQKSKLANFQGYETAFTAWKTAVAIGLGYAYMAVGRNLSYPKSLFYQVGGFDHRVLSGDDDLFVQQARRFAPILYLSHPETFVKTPPQPHFKAFIQQKQRHYSTGKIYDRKPQLIIAFFHFLHFGVLIFPFFIGTNGIILFILQHFLGLWISWDMAKFYQQTNLFTWHNLARYEYLFLQLTSPLLGVLRKETWK